MADIKFYKGVGLGNDFVIIDGRETYPTFPPEDVQRLCHRRYGVGADQLIILGAAQNPEAAAHVNFYNQDGSKAGACGNGSRAVALLLMGEEGRDTILLETSDRLLHASMTSEGVAVQMGKPSFPLTYQMTPEELGVNLTPEIVRGVYVGNTHLVMLFKTIGGIDFPKFGQILAKHPAFPEGCNVNFAHVLNPGQIALVVWEYGAGMTPACGTGAIATAATAHHLHLVEKKVEVQQRGGNLSILFDEEGEATMIGPAEIVYSGVITLEDPVAS